MASVSPGQLAKISTLACTGLLMVLLAILNINAGFNAWILLVQLIPLALTLPGMIKGRVRSAQWLCFVTLFFLVHAILRAFTPERLLSGLVEVLICLCLFVSAIIFIRTSRSPASPTPMD